MVESFQRETRRRLGDGSSNNGSISSDETDDSDFELIRDYDDEVTEDDDAGHCDDNIIKAVSHLASRSLSMTQLENEQTLHPLRFPSFNSPVPLPISSFLVVLHCFNMEPSPNKVKQDPPNLTQDDAEVVRN